MHLPPAQPRRHLGQAEPHRQPGEEGDPQRLPQQEPHDDPQRHRVGQRRPGVRGERDAGVGEREERDDEEGHGSVQLVLDALERGLRGLGAFLHLVDGRLLRVVGEHGATLLAGVLEAHQRLARVVQELVRVDAGAGRDGHGKEHAGHGGVDARRQEARPDRQPQEDVGERAADPEPVGGGRGGQEPEPGGECSPGVEAV